MAVQGQDLRPVRAIRMSQGIVGEHLLERGPQIQSFVPGEKAAVGHELVPRLRRDVSGDGSYWLPGVQDVAVIENDGVHAARGADGLSVGARHSHTSVSFHGAAVCHRDGTAVGASMRPEFENTQVLYATYNFTPKPTVCKVTSAVVQNVTTPSRTYVTCRPHPLDQSTSNFLLPRGFQHSRTLVRSYQSGTAVPLQSSGA